MSAPERREPQSEAALDSRPPSLRSLLSSLFFIPLRARSPPHTVPESSTSPYQPHWHPPPSRERAIVLPLSLSFPLSLGQVRLSDPSHSPYPCPQPCPCSRCVCRISPSPTLRSPPTLLRLLAPPLAPCPLSLSLSLAYLRLLTTFTLSSVSAPSCQFLCETTNGAVRYLPT